ncbi:MAG TPA: hypothetical protein VJH23_00775 [archaeon]|nr:hypothetical protein [archaeon]
MLKYSFFLACMLLLSAPAYASVSMTYPADATLSDGASVQAGFVSPGQAFNLGFSNDSGHGYKWDSITIEQSSLPAGWKIVSINKTDPSLVASIKVPTNAPPNIYLLRVSLSNSSQPESLEQIEVRVIVKRNLLDVSFARKSTEETQLLGGKAIYNLKLTNSSIAPFSVKIGSTLPSNWFSEKSVEIKPNTSQDLELVITPLSSGKFQFSFQAFAGEDNLIVKSYASELNVRPTLKGKFGSPLSGFPFFTFTLLPFQLADSFLSLVLP